MSYVFTGGDSEMKKSLGTLALVLALILVGVGCGGSGNNAEVQTGVGVSALTALSDSHVSGYISSLEVLAMTQEVQSGDWERMSALLKKVEQSHIPATVWYVLPDGSYFTVTQGKTAQNLSDRAYFPGLMSGKNVTGDIVVSKSTGKKSAVVAVPVMKDGKVAGGLGASIFLEDFASNLGRDLGLSGSPAFYAVTDEGQVVLHSDTAMIMKENPVLPRDVEWQTSKLTGWRFALSKTAARN